MEALGYGYMIRKQQTPSHKQEIIFRPTKRALFAGSDGEQFHPSRSLPPCFQKSRTYCCRDSASRVAEKRGLDLAHTSNMDMAESGAF
uniref:Uncharacterized protein n=1 Tax=Romanomermis culicivorax TaxID=13658 RepID=A0A915JYA0_ROMCU